MKAIELVDLRTQESMILTPSLAEAREATATGDVGALGDVNGLYALAEMGDDPNTVRMSRGITPPLRYAVIDHGGTSTVICAERIAPIISYIRAEMPSAEFHYTWTRMVPPFTLVELEFGPQGYTGSCSKRYIQPIPEPAELDSISLIYASAVYEAITGFLQRVPHGEKVAVPLSGGADSGLVYMLAHEAFKQLKRNPLDLMAVTVKLGEGGKDIEQARALVEFLGGHGYTTKDQWHILPLAPSDLPSLEEIVETIEDYKTAWDLQGARIMIAMRKALRARWPELRYTMSGHGGDELAQDYNLGEEGLTFEEVIENPHIYVEGRIHVPGRTNPMFSGGLGRRIVIDPAALHGFTEFSPICTQGVVRVMYGVPKKELISTPEELYGLKNTVASLGVRALMSLTYQFPEKNRFQCGASDGRTFQQAFSALSEAEARPLFHRLMQELMQERSEQ